jgi:hypothetical protein
MDAGSSLFVCGQRLTCASPSKGRVTTKHGKLVDCGLKMVRIHGASACAVIIATLERVDSGFEERLNVQEVSSRIEVEACGETVTCNAP